MNETAEAKEAAKCLNDYVEKQLIKLARGGG